MPPFMEDTRILSKLKTFFFWSILNRQSNMYFHSSFFACTVQLRENKVQHSVQHNILHILDHFPPLNPLCPYRSSMNTYELDQWDSWTSHSWWKMLTSAPFWLFISFSLPLIETWWLRKNTIEHHVSINTKCIFPFSHLLHTTWPFHNPPSPRKGNHHWNSGTSIK